MKAYILTGIIESPDDKDFCITTKEAKELLEVLENEVGKRGYSIYDSEVEDGEI